MSILSGLKWTVSGGHLDDGAFAEIWTAAIESRQAAAHPHLAECPQCRSRYAAFVGWLDRIHDDARDEADEAFPPERLAAQQALVLRRLEALERPARVIAFPKFSRPATSTQGHAQRWVAGAAAAGLVIGLAAGQFVDIRDAFAARRRPPSQTAVQTARVNPVTAPVVVSPADTSTVSDEQIFFGDAVQGVRLSSLDDITPRARDDERP